MKPSSIVTPLATLGLGIAIGWFAKPDSQAVAGPSAPAQAAASAPKPVASSEPASSRSAKSERTAEHKAALEKKKAQSKADIAQEESDAADAKDRMTNAFADSYRKKLEGYLATLDENLNLTPAQKESLKKAIEGQLEEMKKLMSREDAEDNPADFMKNLPPMGPDALDASLAAILSPEQKTTFDAYKTREKARQVDAKALKKLSNLQGLIEFKEGQRDEVYRILSESAERSLAKPNPMAAITDAFSGGAGMNIDMDPYDLGIQQIFMDSASDMHHLEDGDQKAMAKAFREKIDKLIDDKVNELKPVLDEAQLEKYRQELKTKGLGPYGAMFEHMERDVTEE